MIAYIHVNNTSKDNTDPNLFFATDHIVWVRPASMWFDKVKNGTTTRFTRIEFKEKNEMMKAIVCVDNNWAIGNQNNLLLILKKIWLI